MPNINIRWWLWQSPLVHTRWARQGFDLQIGNVAASKCDILVGGIRWRDLAHTAGCSPLGTKTLNWIKSAQLELISNWIESDWDPVGGLPFAILTVDCTGSIWSIVPWYLVPDEVKMSTHALLYAATFIVGEKRWWRSLRGQLWRVFDYLTLASVDRQLI